MFYFLMFFQTNVQFLADVLVANPFKLISEFGKTWVKHVSFGSGWDWGFKVLLPRDENEVKGLFFQPLVSSDVL